MPLMTYILVAGWDDARVENARLMAETIQAQGGRVGLIIEAEPHGPWAAAKRAWEYWWHGDATHLCVLHDDLALRSDWLAATEAAIAARPDDLIVGMTWRPEQATARRRGLAWMTSSGVSNGAMTILPANLVNSFLLHQCANVRPDFPRDGERLSLWALASQRPVHYTVPSLVEHCADTFPSLMRPETVRRRAGCFDHDPLPDYSDLTALVFAGQPLASFTDWQVEA